MSQRILFVTDLTYEARGRRYCDEDIRLSAAMREHFTVGVCHPLDAPALMDDFDVVVVRNSGPVVHHQEAYDRLRMRARETNAKVFPELRGKADQVGKDYLVDLFVAGYPVIPTVDDAADLERLPQVSRYVVKPKFGADSMGLAFVDASDIDQIDLTALLVQPEISFAHEISFYFVDRKFQYALYAPDPHARWDLKRFEQSRADLAFAKRFVDWNDIDRGIQRVDACRTRDGRLLLVELEDWNPYLSLDLVTDVQHASFVADMVAAIRYLATKPSQTDSVGAKGRGSGAAFR